MAVLHDLQCECGWESPAPYHIEQGAFPHCPDCQGQTRPRFDAWTTVSTDIYSTPQYSDAAGRFFSSTREKERHMYQPHQIDTQGNTVRYEAAGDKVHGARADHTLKRSAFSYNGQGSKISTGERNA